MKLGVIGFGNMAEAIIGGCLAGGIINKEDVTVSGKDEAMLAKASENYGVAVERDNIKVVQGADVVLLSVKPQNFPEVLEEISRIEGISEKLFITIAAGIKISTIKNIRKSSY